MEMVLLYTCIVLYPVAVAVAVAVVNQSKNQPSFLCGVGGYGLAQQTTQAHTPLRIGPF